MDQKYVGAVAIGVVAIAVLGGVIIARQGAPTTPTTSNATVEAPYTRVEKDADGVRVQAPGVDVQVPADKSE